MLALSFPHTRHTPVIDFHFAFENLDYLLDYLSILYTVCNNSDVGVRDKTQCNHLTISKRVNSLVVNTVTVDLKRIIEHTLNQSFITLPHLGYMSVYSENCGHHTLLSKMALAFLGDSLSTFDDR